MAVVLRVTGLKKEFGDTLIFEDINFALKEGQKAALIGANGAGKTTLMKCLMGILETDNGSVKTESGFSIGYLEQIPEFAPNTTLMDAVLSSYEDILAQREQLAIMEKQMAYVQDHDLEILMDKYSRLSSQYEINGGFQCEMNVKKVLGGLGFEEEKFSRPISSFSGGEKTKINLACLLAREHPIMFLDEPTNHLDLDSMEWLESYLKSNNSTLLIVSHDRYFLDQVTDSTLNLENHHLKEYNGSYKSFVLQKEAEDLAQERAWEKQQQEVKELEEYINKYRAGIKSKQARGRQSRLDRMKLMEKVNKEKNIGLKIANLQSNRSGNKVLDMEKLSFSFPDKELFADINQQIFYGDNIALIGPNGAGKSTLLKIIMGKIKASKGHLIFGSQVKIGYFDQEHANLNNEKTIIDQLIDEFPLTLQEARDNLGAFLFQEDDIYKKIGNLSGGERARLSFLQLYLRKANFLILDEPTNHMDIHSREVFEEFLLAYPGTILTVSHDRYFLDAIAKKIWQLADGSIQVFTGNFTDYKEKKLQFAAVKEAKNKEDVSSKEKIAVNKSPKNNNQGLSRSRKAEIRKNISQLEQEIENSELRLTELSEILADNSIYQGDHRELQNLLAEYEDLEKNIPLYYQKWENYTQELENNQ